MSGPIATDDVTPVPGPGPGGRARRGDNPRAPTRVGSLPVRRVLPQRLRRTVGSWCFVDHAGPVRAEPGVSFGIGPHPHMGLQPVTWLFDRRASASRQPGLRTAHPAGPAEHRDRGHRLSHAEEDPTLARGVPRRPALGGAARRPGTALLRSSITASCLVSSSTVPRDHAGRSVRRRRLADPHNTEHMGIELTLRGPTRSYRFAPTTSTAWSSWWAGSRWRGTVIDPASWPISARP